jgi:hypothetical protein
VVASSSGLELHLLTKGRSDIDVQEQLKAASAAECALKRAKKAWRAS